MLLPRRMAAQPQVPCVTPQEVLTLLVGSASAACALGVLAAPIDTLRLWVPESGLEMGGPQTVDLQRIAFAQDGSRPSLGCSISDLHGTRIRPAWISSMK